MTINKRRILKGLLALLLCASCAAAVVARAETKPRTASFTLTAVGDIMMHDEQTTSALTETGDYDLSEYFRYVGARLSHADITIGNLEGPVAPSFKLGGFPNFNLPSQLLGELKSAGVDILSVCNNHSLDRDIAGAIETVGQVAGAGMTPIGMYESEKDFFEPYIREINGIKVAFLAYTEHINGKERYYTNGELDGLIKLYDENEAGFDILRARRSGADIVVVFMHWGNEYETIPASRVTKLAKTLAENGADVILGSHPHYVQKSEIITVTRKNGKECEVFVAYSMGNFISNQMTKPNLYGVIIDLEISFDFSGQKASFTAGYSPTIVWRRGKSSGSYKYSVLACHDFLEFPGEGMNDADMRHVKQALDHIDSIMEGSNVPPFDFYQKYGETSVTIPTESPSQNLP